MGIRWWVGVFLSVLAVVFLGFLALMAVDKHYVWFHDVLTQFLKADNHFDGDLWFAAAATIIGALVSAVPGLMCGLLAYIQTERLHELEGRYHRPWLELDEAKVSIAVLCNEKGDLLKSSREIIDGLPWDQYTYRRTIEEAIEKRRPFYIVLKTDFHVKNEVTVKRIFISQVDFMIGKDVLEWILAGAEGKAEENCQKIWKFDRQIGQGGTKYTLEWILCPVEERATIGIWCAMRDFALHKEIRNLELGDLELNVHMNVEYEYCVKDGAECMLRVGFDADNMHSAAVVQENCSCNGYFTYDI